MLAEGAGDAGENIPANNAEVNDAPVPEEEEKLEQEELEQDEPQLFKSSWDPDDKITIKIRIYDMVSNKSYENIGTDTCRKGDEKIQSDDYRIPPMQLVFPVHVEPAGRHNRQLELQLLDGYHDVLDTRLCA